MILSIHEKTLLLNRLPDIKLSYDNILHRKVYADIFSIIPKGKKALVWFTYWKGQNVCFTLMLNERGNICDVVSHPVCFNHELSLSTLLYGTIFETGGFKHFTCENIFYYKGQFVDHCNFSVKLNILGEMFKYYIGQVAYTNNFLIIGLPIMKKDFQEAINCVSLLPYHVYGIQHHNFNASNHMSCSLGIYLIKNTALPEAYFYVKATLQNDIYNLYCYDHTRKYDKIYNIAMIPSYKSSVMMNSLFRTIKENTNLDLLEESDDEEEFENNSDSKFVDLNKSYIMKCVFLKRFRKWQPIEVIKEKETTKIITYKEAQLLEK
jgi:hypothetical protein